jgi:hypothetical protein
MKCRVCENELPKGRPWGTEKKPWRLTCMLPGCPTHGLKVGSKRYKVEVLGRSETEVTESWIRRSRKGVETKREAGFFDDKSNNPYSIDFWLKKGLTEEEAQSKLSEKGQKTIQTKREAGFFDDKSNNPYSIDFWIKKGLSEDEAKNKIRDKNHNCAGYWVKRGHTPEEAENLAAASAATNSLAELEKRYGPEEGALRYVQIRQRLSDSWNPASSAGRSFMSSRQADVLFKRIYKAVRRLGFTRRDVMCNLNEGELYLSVKGNIFFYDFCLKPLHLIIEFNGEHVHPRKDLLTETEWAAWKHAYSKKKAEEVHAYSEIKLATAHRAGYNTLVLWSKDTDNLQKAVSFIKAEHERQSYQAKPQTNSEPVGNIRTQRNDRTCTSA